MQSNLLFKSCSINTHEPYVFYLQSVWSKIQDSRPLKSAPSLLYQEPELILKTIRDLDSSEVSNIIFDDEEVFSHVEHLIDVHVIYYAILDRKFNNTFDIVFCRHSGRPQSERHSDGIPQFIPSVPFVGPTSNLCQRHHPCVSKSNLC